MKKGCVFFLLFLFAASVFSQKRFALVIGNSDYENSPLENPAADSESMAEILNSLGFKTKLIQNTTKKEMQNAISNLAKQGKKADAILFYYAGHGIEHEGEYYLLPVNTGVITQDSLLSHAISLDVILAKISYARAKTNLIFLDSCRSNPLKQATKKPWRGLLVANNPPKMDSFIMFATASGQTADDGKNKHSPFTESLLENLTEPQTEIEQLAKKIREDVRKKTKDMQDPWTESNLSHAFYFVPNGKQIPKNDGNKQDSTDTEENNKTKREPDESDYFPIDKKNIILIISFCLATTVTLISTVQLIKRFRRMSLIKGDANTADFFISKKTVTYRDWNKLAGHRIGLKQDNFPLTKVSWYEAILYCNQLSKSEHKTPYYTQTGQSVRINKNADGYRLPTEREWELAAGNDFPTDATCWHKGNSGGKVHMVKGKKSNKNGIFDMNGNIYEWCFDDICGKKVLKGGCFSDLLQECGTSRQKTAEASIQSKKIGFRVARNA